MIRVLGDNEGSGAIPYHWDLESLAADAFGPKGHLETLLGLEYRAEQTAMATAVARAFGEGESLLFEAGTGVGKSLAYLFSGLLYAVAKNRPFVVATNTISLQEQLLNQDIPMLREVFRKIPDLSGFADFRSTLLVGKANYLCDNRLASALAGQGELFETGQRLELERIRAWALGKSNEGRRQELSPTPSAEIWDAVNADSSLCSGKRCSPDTCCYRRARAEVDKSHLLVVNHSLLFALVGAGATPSGDVPGVLFPRDFVVLDEGHEVPDVASSHLGLGVSSWAISLALKRLYNSAKKKGGLLRKVGRAQDFELVENAQLACEDFFNHIHVGLLDARDIRRLREPGVLPSDIFPPFSLLLRRLKDLAEDTKDEIIGTDLKDQADRLGGYLAGIADAVDLKDSESVYWVERTGRKNKIIHLRSAPLDVAKVLKEALFSRATSVLMTSATLTRGGAIDHFRASVGAEGASEGIEASPFDYEKNVSIRISGDCPDPMEKDRLPYLNYLVKAIDLLASRTVGGSLVLFTNYGDLRHCYNVLRPRWKQLGRSLYGQGEGFSRAELRKRMLEEEDVLLLGAESFWKGFDVPGPALSQVVLTRLPFENPSHPLIEAKAEQLNREGKSPFREMTLPTAVTRFRQGLGRLVRSRDDCGQIAILDSRILRKGYGKDFLSELPKPAYEVFRISN